ncbi:MAG: exonuclease domain-containing protein [Candidatus Cryosericum sp.]
MSDLSALQERKTREFKGKSLIAFPSDYVAVDIETTGFDPSVDEIIELAAVRVVNDEPIDAFSSLVRTRNPIPSFIRDLTGITDGMVAKAPPVDDVLPQFCGFVSTDLVLGHNVNFDINFIYDTLMEHSSRAFENDFVDLMRITRKMVPELEDHRLQTVCRHFNVDTTGHHRGAKDCNMAVECFRKCKELARQKYSTIDEFIGTVERQFWPKATARDIHATVGAFDEDSPLFNQVCVFTGALDGMTRVEAMQAVVNLGGRCGDGVTKETNFLVVGSLEYSSGLKGTKSSKMLKAERYLLKGKDIHIISDKTFVDLLNE